MRKIDEIIIHCSDTPEGREVSVSEIDRWHRQRGFACIGYHYVIHLDGSVEKGRPDSQIGAHCKGHNLHSIGICYIGGKDKANKVAKDTRTERQKVAIRNLIRELFISYPTATVHGHNEFAKKACPCFDVQKEWGMFRNI